MVDGGNAETSQDIVLVNWSRAPGQSKGVLPFLPRLPDRLDQLARLRVGLGVYDKRRASAREISRDVSLFWVRLGTEPTAQLGFDHPLSPATKQERDPEGGGQYVHLGGTLR